MANSIDRTSPVELVSESETIRRAAEGDNAAFAQIAKKYEGIILRVLSSVIVPEEDKNDLYQEGLIGLYKAVLLYDSSISAFSTFAKVCIRSAVSDALRRYQRENIIPSSEFPTEEIPDGIAGTPEEVLMGKEALASLFEQVNRTLSPLERKVFGLHLQGKKVSEIAKILGREQKSVENTLFRARRKLAKPS